MKRYDAGFYSRRHQKTLFAADAILSLVLELLPVVRSAVDVGCGVGTWLTVLREKGVGEIRGIDGRWVDRAFLEIPDECFVEADLKAPLLLDKHYDLAISLEVAEHLPPETASTFVASLTGLADFVLFSAAIPGQAGDNHVNEQWPDYWAELFDAHGFAVVDQIRKQIWDLKRIPVWYRQNALLFVKKERLGELRGPVAAASVATLTRVHPQSYLALVRQQESVRDSWTIFRRAVRAAVKRKISEFQKR